jgi:hypothetical protein
MIRVQRAGKSFQRIGSALFVTGVLLLLGSLVASWGEGIRKWANETMASPPPTTAPTKAIPVEPQPAPVAMIDVARQKIPGVLKQIYTALNDGRPTDAAPILNARILSNTTSLDYLCQPFNYRAHYIQGIVERPNKVFVAYVRTLFKAGGERAYLMYFAINGDHFWLTQVEDNPLTNEQAIATNIARNFLFAARGGQWDAVEKLSNSRGYGGQSQGTPWQTVTGFRSAQTDKVSIITDPFLAIDVKLTLASTTSYEFVDVVVDPTSGKIVELDWGNSKPIITNSEFRQAGLSRFGLSVEQPVEQPVEQ